MALVLAGSGLAHAIQPEDYLAQTVRDVKHAYARHSFVLTGANEKLRSAGTAVLFPAYGVSPKTAPGLTWQLTTLNDDQSVLCVVQSVPDVKRWNTALLTLSKAGLSVANPTTCQSLPVQGYAPAVFPASIAGRVVLDRRDTPSPTRVPSYPTLSGVDDSAVTRPGLFVSSNGGTQYITVYNPFIPIGDGLGFTTGLVGFTVRPGFSVVHSCTEIAAAESCSVAVSYSGVGGNLYPGQLMLYFIGGGVANIGLMGTW